MQPVYFNNDNYLLRVLYSSGNKIAFPGKTIFLDPDTAGSGKTGNMQLTLSIINPYYLQTEGEAFISLFDVVEFIIWYMICLVIIFFAFCSSKDVYL